MVFQQITKLTLWLTGLQPLFSYRSYAILFSSVSTEKNTIFETIELFAFSFRIRLPKEFS